ncbi:MAG: carboxypeptidase-like regulatory domain-containing protein [Planctomycetaceae bacterium]|jgi:hypothetical protein|nr:carboxypeptidase-like regulatory domain-containing protein [Planctomycetaceae bacterium]
MKTIHTKTCKLLIASVAWIIFGVSGCGSKFSVVSGKVALDNAPAAQVTVYFTPKSQESGSNAVGFTDANGIYKLQTPAGKANQGTTPGEYTVTFSKVEEHWDGRSYYTNSSTGEKEKDLRPRELLADIYLVPEKTPFTETVVKGNNTFDFELKSKP